MRYYWPARGNELQIDLDQVTLRQFHKRLGVLRGLDQVKIVHVSEQPSKTAGHWHVTITLEDELPAMERVLLQCALGSDPVREMLNWARIRKADPVPVMFIEPSPRLRTVREVREDNDPDDGLDVDVFGFDAPDELTCGCGMDTGRCSHMELWQPSIQFVRYGKE